MVPQSSDYQRQISQLQSDKALAMQEVERLNDIIRGKEAESGKYRAIIAEN